MDFDTAATLTRRQLLAQRRWWRTDDGKVVERKDMALPHKLNLMAYLERNAKQIEFRDAMQVLSPDMPDEVVDELGARDPVEWIRSSPLYRALLEDVIVETTKCTRKAANLVCRGPAAAERRSPRGSVHGRVARL